MFKRDVSTEEERARPRLEFIKKSLNDVQITAELGEPRERSPVNFLAVSNVTNGVEKNVVVCVPFSYLISEFTAI